MKRKETQNCGRLGVFGKRGDSLGLKEKGKVEVLPLRGEGNRIPAGEKKKAKRQGNRGVPGNVHFCPLDSSEPG